MTANQFYVSRLEENGRRAVVEGAEHHHMAHVARVKPGDTVWLFDAAGGRYLARVETIGAGRTELAVIRREEAGALGTRFVLAQALVPAKKMEFILEKAAEVGFTEFQPLATARSLKPAADRSERKVDRWRRIALEAVKQSKGRGLPEVHAPVELETFVRREEAGIKIVLSEHGGTPLRFLLPDCRTEAPAPEAIVLCVGPVGGWTDGEERLFREAGYQAASLGRRILKSETAALAAAAMIVHFWNA